MLIYVSFSSISWENIDFFMSVRLPKNSTYIHIFDELIKNIVFLFELKFM